MLFPPQMRVFRRLWMCRSYSSLQGLSGPPTLLLCAAAEQTTRNVEAQVGSLLCVLPCPGAQPLSGLSVCLPLWVCVSPAPSPSFLQRQDGTSLLTHFLGKRLFDPCPLLSGLVGDSVTWCHGGYQRWLSFFFGSATQHVGS